MLSASQGNSAFHAGDQDLHALAASLVYSCAAQGMRCTSVLGSRESIMLRYSAPPQAQRAPMTAAL